MKRYFLVCDEEMPCPVAFKGQWHAIQLGSHGECGAGHQLVCLVDEHIVAPAEWVPLPPIYDARTTLAASAVDQGLLADVGLTGDETTLEAVFVLGGVHPMLGY